MSKNWKKCFKPLIKTTNKVWRPIVHWYQLSWGPFVHGNQMFGDCLSRRTNCLWDHLSMGTKCLGTNCQGGPIVLGTKWAGTVCSWRPIVGDQMSGDWMCSGPNEKQPRLFDLSSCTHKWGERYFIFYGKFLQFENGLKCNPNVSLYKNAIFAQKRQLEVGVNSLKLKKTQTKPHFLEVYLSTYP
jgi:hypothetical protein